MAGKIILARADENLIADAVSVVVTVGTPLTGYGVGNLLSKTWAVPFKVAETAVEVRFHYAAPVLPEFPALGNSNLDVPMLLEGHSSDVWTAPNVSVTLAAPTRRVDLFYTSPFSDMRNLTPQEHWRIVVTGNALPIVMGALWLGSTYREFEAHVLDSATRSLQSRVAMQDTAYGSELAYQQGPVRLQQGAQIIVRPDEVQDIVDWMLVNSGPARMFFVALNDAVDDVLQCRLVSSDLEMAPLGFGNQRVALPLREVSRGLRW